MNTKRNIVLSLLFLFLSVNLVPGQRVFEGKMEGYDRDAARFGAGFMEPFPVGTVRADGGFSIPLDTTFPQRLQESIARQNEESADWKTSLMTLERAFGNCGQDTIAITNGSQSIVKLSMFNSYPILNFAEKENYGFMVAATSPEFAKVIASYETGDDTTGYYIDWYYFEEPATVKGTCSIKSYTLTQQEEDLYEKVIEYDLDFQAGWNLVQYGYTDLYEDSAGGNYARRIVYQTLKEMPADIQFLYFSE